MREICISGVEEHSPDVYELDTTDLTCWKENVEQRAEAIVEAFLKVANSFFSLSQSSTIFLQNETIPFPALPKTPIDEPVYEQNTCTTCDRVFHLKSQWLRM